MYKVHSEFKTPVFPLEIL